MKWIKLLTSAYVNGALRHPHEGVIHVSDEEGDRLVNDSVGEDVSSDFDDEQDKAPSESIVADSNGLEVPDVGEAHQAEVAPQDAEPATPIPGRRAAKPKE